MTLFSISSIIFMLSDININKDTDARYPVNTLTSYDIVTGV
ncbi:hypothetical protein SAMN05216301_2465 [Morganella morganii]|nr:hypothetical protein SAMN05216301_2465 [Morganella morganii]